MVQVAVFQYSMTLFYAQESMETKTEMLEDMKLALPANTRVADMQKEIEKKLGWEPTSKLERYMFWWGAVIIPQKWMLINFLAVKSNHQDNEDHIQTQRAWYRSNFMSNLISLPPSIWDQNLFRNSGSHGIFCGVTAVEPNCEAGLLKGHSSSDGAGLWLQAGGIQGPLGDNSVQGAYDAARQDPGGMRRSFGCSAHFSAPCTRTWRWLSATSPADSFTYKLDAHPQPS